MKQVVKLSVLGASQAEPSNSLLKWHALAEVSTHQQPPQQLMLSTIPSLGCYSINGHELCVFAS